MMMVSIMMTTHLRSSSVQARLMAARKVVSSTAIGIGGGGGSGGRSTSTRVRSSSSSLLPSLRDDRASSPSIRAFSTSSPLSSSSSSSQSVVDPPTYTLALTRELPETFQNAITKYHHDGGGSAASTSIDLQRAKDQHAYYVEQLQAIVPKVVVLPPLNHLPDSVFVEDTVVVVDQIAVMTRPGHPSRQPEVHDFKMQLREYTPSFKLIVGDMNVGDADGHDDESDMIVCDGGDVLYTGRHLFVGLSSRTNRKAVDVLKNTFGFYDDNDVGDDVHSSNKTVVAVEPKSFADYALHLKSVVTAVDSRTLLAPTGAVGDQVLEEMGAYEKGYDVVRLPSMLACNVVSANGGLLAQDGGCSESKSILEKMAKTKGLDLRWVDCSELAKADAALTCCSVLLNV